MAEPYDRAAKEAEELLPCDQVACPVQNYGTTHLRFCAAYRRPAVAAKLREAYAEIERLKALDTESAKAHNSNLLEMGDIRTEVARLRAELATKEKV